MGEAMGEGFIKLLMRELLLGGGREREGSRRGEEKGGWGERRKKSKEMAEGRKELYSEVGRKKEME